MAILTVTGGPTPPAGKTLAAGTRLTVRFVATYLDGTTAHARVHEAEYDITNDTWKPVGSADGTVFTLPGAAAGAPTPPNCLVVERQVYSDASEQVYQRAPLVILESSPGAWWFPSVDQPLLAGNTIGQGGTELGYAGAPTWPYGLAGGSVADAITYAGIAVTYGGEAVTYASAG